MKVAMMPSPTLYTRQLAKALEARGAEVAFVEGFYRTAYLPWLQLPWRFVRGFDVFHVHWIPFWSEALLHSFLKAMPRSRPLAWTFHNLHPHRPDFRDDLAETRRAWERADIRFVHSDANARDFADLGMTGATVVPHGNFHGVFPDTTTRDEARARVGLPRDAFVVGFFGPTGPYKGADTFVRAVRQAPGVTGYVFGACPDPVLARELTAAVGPDLKVDLRRIEDDEMQYSFRACDAVALPYERITTSGSVFFPAAFGVPVVASPLGNIPDVVEDGVTGLLARGPEAFAAAFLRLRDEEDTAGWGRRFHDDVARRFDWGPIAERTLDSYRTAMDAPA